MTPTLLQVVSITSENWRVTSRSVFPSSADTVVDLKQSPLASRRGNSHVLFFSRSARVGTAQGKFVSHLPPVPPPRMEMNRNEVSKWTEHNLGNGLELHYSTNPFDNYCVGGRQMCKALTCVAIEYLGKR